MSVLSRPAFRLRLAVGVGLLVAFALAAVTESSHASAPAEVKVSDFGLSTHGSTAKARFKAVRTTVRPAGRSTRASAAARTHRPVRKLVLAVRDSAGRTHDFVHRDRVALAERRTFSGSRAGLAPGRYRAWVAYSLNGTRWKRASRVRTLTVRAPQPRDVAVKNFDVSVSGSTVNARYDVTTSRRLTFASDGNRDSRRRRQKPRLRPPLRDGAGQPHLHRLQDAFAGHLPLVGGLHARRQELGQRGTPKTFTVTGEEDTPPPEPETGTGGDGPGGTDPAAGGTPTPPAGGPWKLAFGDEFDDSTFDTAKWDWKYPRSGDMIYSNWNNGEAQWYKRENISQRNGALELSAKREATTSPYSGRTFQYTSGLIHSKPSFNFRYGYMETRMWLPKGSGFWPAFWTWSTNEQWPPEIDAMEFYGDNPAAAYLTYHSSGSADGTQVRNADWTTGWHTFAVDWEPGKLTWYVDGVARKTVNQSPNLNMYLIANLAIANGARAPAPNSSTPLPSALKVDYIRVWQR